MSADVELIAFAAGLKPALRVRYAARLPAGVHCCEATDPNGERLIYVARDAELADRLRRIEAPILPGTAMVGPSAEVLDRHRELGRLLGYPRCCVDAFVARVARGVTRAADGSQAHEEYVAAEDALERTQRVRGRLQFLWRSRRAYLVPFYPCTFDCSIALRYATAVLDHVGTPEAARLGKVLMRPVWLSKTGEHARDGEGLRIEPMEF